MARVYAIGETVLDIIFKNGKVKEAVPGGSMLNASVSMSRAGLDVALISDTGNDKTARLTQAFLEDNGVGCRYICRQKGVKTPLALAFLDQNNDACYEFYRDAKAKDPGFALPPFSENDILLFGSYYSLSSRTRDSVREVVHRAADKGVIIIYDLNFRSPHAGELPDLLPVICENTKLAHIVRGSEEDLVTIFNDSSLLPLREFAGETATLAITRAGKPVQIDSPSLKGCFPVRKIKTVSTIGAGDSFNAGIIYGIVKERLSAGDIRKLGREQWQRITEYGSLFASDVCCSYGNYISSGLADSMKSSSSV